MSSQDTDPAVSLEIEEVKELVRANGTAISRVEGLLEGLFAVLGANPQPPNPPQGEHHDRP